MPGVAVSTDGPIMNIRLERPEAFNAFNDEMGRAFLGALAEADDASIRAVVITGAGKAFCAGEDLRALQSDYDRGEAPDHAGILRRRYNPAIVAIRALAKPVIAGVNGVAAGAGVSLALACDLRILSVEASFVLGFAKVGLVPDSGATWFLPRYVGLGRAFALAIGADRIGAEEALEMGLADAVVPVEGFDAAVRAKANELALGPTVAYASIRKLIWDSFDSSLEKHLEAEAEAQSRAGRSADHLEGVRAFGEKRQPGFQGR